MTKEKIEQLEKNLGYIFKDKKLLEQALTHPSKGHEKRQKLADNQRLEFLGDAVLQMVVTDIIFHLYLKDDEGKLTKMRAQLVNRHSLQELAQSFQIGDFLILGKGEIQNEGRNKTSNLADAMEAVIGAIYLDSTFDLVRGWIETVYSPFIKGQVQNPKPFNPKGVLQELLQSQGKSAPLYQLIDETGPDHEKQYTIAVLSEDQEIGRGVGSSKKAAESNSAAEALKALQKMS